MISDDGYLFFLLVLAVLVWMLLTFYPSVILTWSIFR